MHSSLRAAGRTLLAVLALFVAPTLCAAHPHAFIEAQLTFRFDEDGLAGFEQRWRMDPMLSATLLDMVDMDRDQRLSAEEHAQLEEISMGSLRDFSYFTFARLDGAVFEAGVHENFRAHVEDGSIIYEFFIPCRVVAVDGPRTVKAAVYDPTFYTFVALVDENGAGIDPTRDPRFGDPMVEAAAGDFQRFVEATGFEQAHVEAQYSGAASAFTITAQLEQAEEMAYFGGGITPYAFVLTFSRP